METKLTVAQILVMTWLKEQGFAPFPGYHFCERMWRFDVAVPDSKVAFEISGGNWTGGHRRGKKQEEEYDKLNAAQAMGWKVIQWTNRQVLSGEALEFIKEWKRSEVADVR